MATLSDLTQSVITRLSMIAGTGVQIYAEERIAAMIQHKFDMVRMMLWWDDMMEYVELTQDASGRPIENVVRELPVIPVGSEIVINKFKDIQYAWRVSDIKPLSDMRRRANPAQLIRPGRTMHKIADPAKVIRFVPYTVNEVVWVRYRKHYSIFLPDDDVPLDRQLMILGATYDFLEDDGTNPGATEKFRNMFNHRLGQLTTEENMGEVPLTPEPHVAGSGYQVV